jgi:hypothetical protein
MARAVSRKSSRKSVSKVSVRKSVRKSSPKRRVNRKHASCVSTNAKKMFKKMTPRTAKGRGRVLARAQKHCAKKH